VVEKIGCRVFNKETVEIAEICSCPGGVLECLQEQIRESMAYYNLPSHGILLLGRSDTDRLYGEIARRFPMRFEVEPNLFYTGEDGHMRILMGCDVVIVPWMEGAIFIPDKLISEQVSRKATT
jgi:hypothetical protein